jgi:hypothetical protein
MDMTVSLQRTVLAGIALAACVPAIAIAQLPGLGSLGRRTPLLKRDPGIDVPAPINIVNLVVQNRQDLALTDTQWVRIIAIKRTLDSTNAPLVRRIDSVARLFKSAPIFSQPTAARRDSIEAGKALVKEVSADIDDNIAEAKDKVFVLLTTPQKERSEQIEDKARKASVSGGRGRL